MKFRLDLVEQLTAQDLMEEVLANNHRYKPEPLLSKTGTGSSSSGGQIGHPVTFALAALLPVERPAMQVHHRLNEESVCGEAVNDGVWEAMKVEFAVVTSEEAPAFRFGDDPAQGGFELLEERLAQAGLPLVVPQGRCFEFLFGLRMADDAH